MQPFDYAEEGYPDILELPFQFWLDVVWFDRHGYDTGPAFLEALKGAVDEVAAAVLAAQNGAPGPSLLTDEPSNLHEFRQGEDTQMHGYSWVDRNAGTVRIPIDRAKELLLQRGISGGKPIPPSTTNPSTNAKTNKGGGQR